MATNSPQFQANDAYSHAGVNIDAGNAAVVFAYSSTIDQLSGDPTYQSPVLLADPKTIFAKKMTADVGKSIDNARAKSIRDASMSLGQAQLVRDASGYRITR